MSDPLNCYYLQTMGIESWEIRQPTLVCENPLTALKEVVAGCTRCPLHKTRTQTVFSRGNSQAKLMIIGEAPGFYEDKQGKPFVGKAGLLLNEMLSSIGLKEGDVYVANVIKCRPPENRDPLNEEISQCSGYLKQQIELVNPRLILALGRFAGQFLKNQSYPLDTLRQHLHYFEGVPFVVTYHPAYLLRKPSDKKKTYADLLLLKKYLME